MYKANHKVKCILFVLCFLTLACRVSRPRFLIVFILQATFLSSKLFLMQSFHDLRFTGAKRGSFIGRAMSTETAASTLQRMKVSLSDAS